MKKGLNKMSNNKKTDYDDILISKSFDIVIRCKHCQAVGGFIGIKDLIVIHQHY